MSIQLTVSRLVILIALLSSCTSIKTERNDWSTYTGPGAEHFRKPEVRIEHLTDPAEPFNRTIWAANRGAITYVVGPIARGWRAITPSFLRTGLTNFGRNLLYPVRLVNNLVQAKGTGAWNETRDFVVNTTVGVAGFWDPADNATTSTQEDFGQSLESAGWEDSRLAVFPLLGPTTVRDSLGLIVDSVLDPASYFFPASPVRSFNDRSGTLGGYGHLEKTTYDLYYLAQRLTTLHRDVELSDYTHSEEDCSLCAASETIQAIFLRHRDDSFPWKGKQRKIKLPARDESLPYTLFLQPEPASLVYILPGLGGHRLGNSAMALAEMVYNEGFSAVTISSSMNFEFIETASSVDLPGFAPVDAKDVHLALDAINSEIDQRYPGRVTNRVLMGMSLGAFHTLFLAAADVDPANELVSFDRYIAINPPVRLDYGMSVLDGYYNAPMELPEETRQDVILHTLRKAIRLGDGTLSPATGLPFSELEAQFLIGLAFRSTLRDVIFQTQERNNMGVLKTKLSKSQRSPIYDEISDFSFIEYFYAFLLPYFAERLDGITHDEAGAQKLFEMTDLRSIEANLRQNGRVVLFTNKNDFLLREVDIEWISGVFGMERCIHFDHGGHLGNLYLPEIRELVMEPLVPLIAQ